MLDILSRLIGGLVPNVIKSLTDRSRLKIICGWGNEINANGVGNYLAMWVKIINPTSSPIYFERLEAIDQAGEVFFPYFFRVKTGDEIQPQRNIVGLIPCGHITSTRPKELRVYDSTERRYTIKGRTLRKSVEGLAAEQARLEHLSLNVHPSHPE